MILNTSANSFKSLVNQIKASSYITFTNDKVDLTSTRHTKALHVSLKCKGYIIMKVLIDNRFILNILPMITLEQQPIEKSFIRPSLMMVKLFYGTKIEVVCNINLKLKIGPYVFLVPFHIMEIRLTYNILLGRLQIHFANVMHSALYKKITHNY